VKRIEAAIVLRWSALYQTALLQIIQNANQTTRVHGECLRQILL
jgi:hypothetical protein